MAIVGLAGLAACGVSPEVGMAPGLPPSFHASRFAEGKLSQSLKQLESEAFFYKNHCDSDIHLNARRRVVSFLEQNQNLLSADERRSSGLKSLGPNIVYDPTPYWEKPGDIGLKIEPIKSWLELDREILSFENEALPQEKSFEDLVSFLNNQTRQNLAADHLRKVLGLNLNLRPESLETLRALRSKIDLCLDRADLCLSEKIGFLDDFKQSEFNVLEESLIYSQRLSWIESAQNKSEFVDALVNLKSWLEMDLYRWSPKSDNSVKRISENKYQLTLNSGDFRGYEDVLSDWLSMYWQHEDFDLHVVWNNLLDPVDVANFFSLKIFDQLFERSFVDRETRTLNMSMGFAVSSLNHEIGHVLGFVDSYYTLWNPDTCQYLFAFDDSDIMSNHFGGGKVKENLWNSLDVLYPLEGKQ